MKLRNTLISIPAQGAWLDGRLAHAPDVRGLAVLPRSSGHPALDTVAQPVEVALQSRGFATIRLDLLTRQEALRDPDASFNIARLTERILATVEWVAHQPPLAGLQMGLVAHDTGCAAAIRAAVKAPETFSAIACVDGRADLAGAEPLRHLRCPVRFIVSPGAPESAILEKAFALLGGPRHWLALPDTGDARQQEILQARAVTSWLEQHLTAVERTRIE